jgi:hypothetical protein
MPDPIKQQIMARVISNLTPLVTNATFRSLTRENDRLRETKSLPALMIADGNEITYAKTSTVRTCRFPLEVRIIFAKSRDSGAKKDVLVAEVQKAMEGDITLGGLGTVLNAGNEQPSHSADHDQTHRTLLTYTVEYTRKISDPYLSS